MHIPLFIPIAVSLLFFTLTIQATTIYSWVDNNGTVHFTDQPNAAHTKVYELVTPPSTPLNPIIDEIENSGEYAELTLPSAPEALPPATIRFITPSHEQTLRSNAGHIDITASSSREITKDYKVQVVLDGNSHLAPQNSLTFSLFDIDRGSHQLQLQLLKDGKVIALSNSITVYLHRASTTRIRPPAARPKL
ncbi:MAG: DUF4124 domain-containing protein [Photobacterium frigidiphilum]|uniref:DUF4124 domain-containing protein n=1 Tax=Photobacterium frigidiphilum TaxID=264736 RepID=UPI003001829C